MNRLRPQLTSGVSLLTLSDAGEESIGRKRQRLIEAAMADYVSFVDDDDLVARDYCERALAAIEDGPDVVGFRLRYFTDGRLAGHAVHSYVPRGFPESLPRGCKRWDRLPNHLNPTRRTLALRVGYTPINFGEDAEYARGLERLRPSEVFVDEVMYEYLHRSSRGMEVTNEVRTGKR